MTALMLLCLCLCGYGAGRVFGFTLLPDEFGYWAAAAENLGWDWSETASLGSYYSFGYSLILTPLLFLCRDSLTAYRLAVAVNALLMCLGLYLMYRLMVRLFGKEEKRKAVFVSGIAVITPVWMYYVQMTMTEALLLFLYVWICYLFVRFLEKPGVLAAMALAAALVYIYFVHMRSVGILAAGGAVLLLWTCLTREERSWKKGVFCAICLLALLAVGIAIKAGVVDSIYQEAPAGLLSMSDYSGQWSKIRSICSLSGAKDFCLNLTGKLLYMGLSTYGLAWRGLSFVWKRMLRPGKGFWSREHRPLEFFWLFVFLATAAQVCIVTVFTIDAVREGASRLDMFVNGRYEEPILPILAAAGLYQLLESRHPWKETGAIAGGALALNAAAVWVAKRAAYTENRSFSMIGMSYVSWSGAFGAVPFLWRAFAVGVFLTVLVTLAAVLYRKARRAEWLLVLIIAAQVILGLRCCERYIYISNSRGNMDAMLAGQLKHVLEEREAAGERMRIIHLYEDGRMPYIEQVQFRMREKKIEVWRGGMENLTENDIVIADAESSWSQILYEEYDRCWHGGHLDLFYNE